MDSFSFSGSYVPIILDPAEVLSSNPRIVDKESPKTCIPFGVIGNKKCLNSLLVAFTLAFKSKIGFPSKKSIFPSSSIHAILVSLGKRSS